MNPKYRVGQKVIIRPVNDQTLPDREGNIGAYAGQTGKISNYYWITPRGSQVFYIYTVRFGSEGKALVLYEDEIKPV